MLNIKIRKTEFEKEKSASKSSMKWWRKWIQREKWENQQGFQPLGSIPRRIICVSSKTMGKSWESRWKAGKWISIIKMLMNKLEGHSIKGSNSPIQTVLWRLTRNNIEETLSCKWKSKKTRKSKRKKILKLRIRNSWKRIGKICKKLPIASTQEDSLK